MQTAWQKHIHFWQCMQGCWCKNVHNINNKMSDFAQFNRVKSLRGPMMSERGTVTDTQSDMCAKLTYEHSSQLKIRPTHAVQAAAMHKAVHLL